MQPGDSGGDRLISGIGARARERGIVRRRFVLATLGLLGGVPAFAVSPVAANDTVLRVLAWPGYADRDVVNAFETQFHVRVEVTFVDSDEALWARMQSASPPPYDVLAANTAEIQRYARERLLAPIDLSRIPNRERQVPGFRQLATIGGLVHGNAAYGIQ